MLTKEELENFYNYYVAMCNAKAGKPYKKAHGEFLAYRNLLRTYVIDRAGQRKPREKI